MFTGILTLLSPVGSVVSWILSPLGKYISIALLILAAVGGIYAKARVDQYRADEARIERNAADAVKKADTARTAAQTKFDKGDYTSKPNVGAKRLLPFRRKASDGFARD